MGWPVGSELMTGIIEIAQEYILDDDERKEFYREVVKMLEAHHWDAQDEPLGEDDAYDELYEELNPEKEVDDSNDDEYKPSWVDDYPDDIDDMP